MILKAFECLSLRSNHPRKTSFQVNLEYLNEKRYFGDSKCAILKNAKLKSSSK